jgi:hypothetical protein
VDRPGQLPRDDGGLDAVLMHLLMPSYRGRRVRFDRQPRRSQGRALLEPITHRRRSVVLTPWGVQTAQGRRDPRMNNTDHVSAELRSAGRTRVVRRVLSEPIRVGA